ncbi:calcium-binding protein [Maliponia aquimaris]|uniref:calcium-binding protein n=1 Tax=Maliponia aquimaris TaxID=1673631 RepID=UPI00159564F3|nr:calcium-binding protein [Maliponia aquimaris]
MAKTRPLKTSLSISPEVTVTTAPDTGGAVRHAISKDMPTVLNLSEEVPGHIDLSGVKFNSLGSKKNVLTIFVSTNSGTLDAAAGSGVAVSGAGTGVLALMGKLSDLMTYLGNPTALSYTGAKDVFGIGAATLSFAVQSDKYIMSLGAIPVNLADVTDTVTGTALDDTLYGEAGRNVMIGMSGNDFLDGMAGDDVIYGDAGNDTIVGGPGADTLFGGTGDDVLYYRGSFAGVVVDLNADASGNQSASGGEAQGDVISGFEHVYASEYADTIRGDAGKNILFGYGGNDVILGFGGDDVIRGGAGADTLDGGDGLDWVRYLGSPTGVTVSLVAGVVGIGGDAEGDVLTGFENIQGSEHSDRLFGDAGDNYIWGFTGSDYIDGGAGNDSIRGGEGADTMLGGDGIDTLQYVDLPEGVRIDLRVGVTGFQSASGGEAQGDVISGFENVFGGDGDDHLTGDAGRNYLYGYAGNDTLAGREGRDVLKGFAGADHFVFDTALAASNVDRILDFESGVDTIVLNRAIFGALALGDLDASAFLASDTPVATSADHRILYETDTGTLYYDADGSGGAAAVAFAQLTSLPTISADDFLIV